jgi:uncharacterized membrane protein (DUF485 family)
MSISILTMEAFLAALLSFPTVFFTSLVGLSLFYWLTVIVGALDIDFLSPDAAHGGGDIGHDAGAHHETDPTVGSHEAHGISNFISLGKVPVTILFSVFTFIGWLLSMCGEMWLRSPIAGTFGDVIYGMSMGTVIMVMSFIFTGYMVRPLRGMFSLVTEHAGVTLIGRMVRITSRSVSTTFGTATCDNAGAGILMRINCREGITLKRDDMAVVVSYDSVQQTYLVAPFSHTPVDAIDAATDAVIPKSLPPSTPATPVSLERRAEPPH